MRVFFATDVHGSEVCWRKFLNAGAFHKADVLVMGGDMTGKAMVPITGAKADFTVPVAFPTVKVELDPGYEVLRWTPEYHAAAAVQAPAKSTTP